jgi:hypothetical protein
MLFRFFLVILGFSASGAREGWAGPGPVDPMSRGVFIQDRHRGFFQVMKKVDDDPGILDAFGKPIFPKEPEFVIVPTPIGKEHATPGGQTFYPFALTSTLDGIPENDPVSGREFGPAGLTSKFDPRTKTISVEYSNGFHRRKHFRLQAPEFITELEGAWTDAHSNVFWIRRSLNREVRIFHENALHRDLPLNELVFGGKVSKVRGDPGGKGLILLLEDGQVLRVEVPADFSLHVSRVNRLEDFRVVDLEVGPLGEDPFQYALVLFGAEGASGQMGLRVHTAAAIQKPHAVPLSWVDPFRRTQTVDFIEGVYGNVHEVGLERLLDRHPSELNRFLQFHYELRQEEIGLLLRNANTPGRTPLSIGRRVILDERAPGLCRYYMMSHYGLSPDLYLN